MIVYVDKITRSMLKNDPSTLFVFGDNLQRRGFGGLAKECRGERNAIGIPTKRAPSMEASSFFTDDDLMIFRECAEPSMLFIVDHLRNGRKVVWPKAGIGTGLAQLKERAPRIWRELESFRMFIESEFA